jgi:hypothetical protein
MPGCLAISLVFPAILWASAAVAAPVIIHLIMRTKPRKIVFPAMRFVRKTHQANISKLRLKHLILLALRMSTIMLLVLLVARAFIPDWRSGISSGAPAAAVVVVDNSASMAYVSGGMTSLGRGQKLASDLVNLLPDKSRVAIVRSSDPSAGAAFLSDRALASQQIAETPNSQGGQGVGAAVARAVAMLGQSDMQRKEAIVVTDQAAHAWADFAPPGAESVRYTVLTCGAPEDLNVALGDLKPSAASIPLGGQVDVDAVITSAKTGGEVTVQASLGADVVDQKPVRLSGGGASSVSFTIKPLREGPAHGALTIRQSDPLEVDNKRYFTVNVGSQANVLIIRDATTVGKGDAATHIMATALAPPGGEAPASRRIISADRFDEQEKLDGVDVVMLCDVSSLADAQWARLDSFVRGGGRLWVVAGALLSAASYNVPAAQAILPAAIKNHEELPQSVKFDTSRLNGAMLEPFTSGGNPPLSDIDVYRRYSLASRAPDAAVVLAYADGVPAILTRAAGDGAVVFWNFSPAPGFSNLASREHLVVLTMQTLRVLAADVLAPAMYQLGQTATIGLPRGMRSPAAMLRTPGESGQRSVPVDVRNRAVMIPCDRLGHWTLELTEGSRRAVFGFSVNVPASESNLAPMSSDKLAAMFPADRFAVISDAAQLTDARLAVSQKLDLMTPVLICLLILMTAESFFANRFYKRAAGPVGPTPAPIKRESDVELELMD